jgi:RimJ/RimL family protein N-acetyltransferase
LEHAQSWIEIQLKQQGIISKNRHIHLILLTTFATSHLGSIKSFVIADKETDLLIGTIGTLPDIPVYCFYFYIFSVFSSSPLFLSPLLILIPSLVVSQTYTAVVAEPENHVFEIGYWIGRTYWSKGIAPQAVQQIVDYLFNTFPHITRIQALPHATNIGSQRVLRKSVINITLQQ